MKEKKKVKIVVALIFTLFATWNIVWFASYSIGYNNFS